MPLRFRALPVFVLLAAGCSAPPYSLLRFDRQSTTQPAAAATQPAAAVAQPVAVPAQPAAAPEPPPADDWCARLAANTRARAAADGFDTATQERMTQQSFRQCAMLNPG